VSVLGSETINLEANALPFYALPLSLSLDSTWWRGAVVGCRTRDRKVAGSTPGRALSSQLG